MRTLRKIAQALSTMPRGFNADGRALGLGLDAALHAQRSRGADVEPLRPSMPTRAEDSYSRAS